jgi:hypothetical protein
MMGKWSSILLVLCASGAAATAALAQQPASASEAARQEASPPARSLRELRKDVRKAEERFQALYNKLNPEREQQVVCEDSSSLGTRLSKHSCTTEGARSAAAQDVADYMSAVNRGAAQSGQEGGNGSPAELAAAAAAPGVATSDTEIAVIGGAAGTDEHRTAFRRNLDKLLAEHADLRQALGEYVTAQQRYAAAGGK